MRKKLGKLIGVEDKYTGIMGEVSRDGLNVVIRDIKHNNKDICDHVWISKTKNLREDLLNEEVTFVATAITYTDSRGNRKNGLSKCHSVRKKHEAYDTVKHDFIHHTRRMK